LKSDHYSVQNKVEKTAVRTTQSSLPVYGRVDLNTEAIKYSFSVMGYFKYSLLSNQMELSQLRRSNVLVSHGRNKENASHF